MNVMIGIDPHKASHTAVAIDGDEDQLSSVKVRATRRQVDRLMSWADPSVDHGNLVLPASPFTLKRLRAPLAHARHISHHRPELCGRRLCGEGGLTFDDHLLSHCGRS
jgi:hypothetical protein